MNKKIRFPFLVIFAITPLFCILLDIFMTITAPTQAHKDVLQNFFDITIASETIYFSIWTSILTIIWATCSMINYYRKSNNKIKWAESEHVLTMIVAYQFLVMLIYTGATLFATDKIEGMSTWYNILKSVLEHWIIPVVLMVYYFLVPRETQLSAREYVKNTGWKTCILPIIYIIYVTTRAGLLKDYTTPELQDKIYQIFPYKGGNPFVDKVYIWLPGYVVAIFSGLGFGTLFNYLSIKTTNKFWKQ